MAILSGKLVVGQSGGTTAVMNASLQGVIEEAQGTPGIEAVWGLRNGIEGLLAADFASLSRLGLRRLVALGRTPGAALRSCRHRLTAAEAEYAVEVLRQHDIRYFLYIGGNDSADTTLRLSQAAHAAGWEMRAIAVPKTIDNDLPLTDHCPGYGSAARFIAQATVYSELDSITMAPAYQVKVIELMGRNAGWLVASAALARRGGRGAPHIICLPERPFEPDRFIQQVKDAYRQDGYVVVVACETLRDTSGQPLGQRLSPTLYDAFGHPHLAGAALVLTDLVRKELGLVTRWERPGSIQRTFAACISEVDRQEARQAGVAAVQAAVRGESGQMVTLIRQAGPEYHCTTGLAPLAAIANQERTMPAEFLHLELDHISDAFLEYARPLIGAPIRYFPRQFLKHRGRP
jgi:ATP-dependent phosphofructokinase / diphosphate-dependent phosphofructokinase